MTSIDSRVVASSGEILLSVGASLIRVAEDAKAEEWAARLKGLAEVDVHGATRTEIVLREAAGYALIASGGIAWRHEAFHVLDVITAAYLQTLPLYLVTQNGLANDWFATVLADSEILGESEPWVRQNAGTAVGIVTGIAMLRILVGLTDEELAAFGQDPNDSRYPFGDFPALREKCWGWFGTFAEKCAQSSTAATALQAFIFSPQKAGLRGACARITPALESAIRKRRTAQWPSALEWVPGGSLWLKWVGDLLKS